MKIALIVLLVFLSIVVLVTGIGLALPANHVASTKAYVPAQPIEVWNAITGLKAFPTWRSDVKSVDMLPDSAGKLAWREVGSNGRITYAQAEAVPPSHLKVKLTDNSLPFGGTWTYVIAPVATGSEITITEDGIVRNPIFRFVSRFVFGHHKAQETYLRDLGKKFNHAVTPVRL